MKRAILILFACLAMVVPGYAQSGVRQTNTFWNETLSASGDGSGVVSLLGSGTNTIILDYYVTGSPTAWSVEIDVSADALSYATCTATNNPSTQATVASGATSGVIVCSYKGRTAKAHLNSISGGTTPKLVYSLMTVQTQLLTAHITPRIYGYSLDFNAYMQALPSSQTTLTANNVLVKFYCNNTTGSTATFTITDNQGSPVAFVSAFQIGANSDVTFPPGGGYAAMQGVKWGQVTASAVNCSVEGYQQ